MPGTDIPIIVICFDIFCVCVLNYEVYTMKLKEVLVMEPVNGSHLVRIAIWQGLGTGLGLFVAQVLIEIVRNAL